MFPIEEVRQQFPALNRHYNGKQVAYFDGPGGSQVVKSVIDAMVSYMTKVGLIYMENSLQAKKQSSTLKMLEKQLQILLVRNQMKWHSVKTLLP